MGLCACHAIQSCGGYVSQLGGGCQRNDCAGLGWAPASQLTRTLAEPASESHRSTQENYQRIAG
jgi:hypothetical protein